MTPEEFRAAGHQLIDWIADYRTRVYDGALPVIAQTSPGEVRAAIPASPPVEGEPFDALLRDVDRIVVPGLTLWQHPSFHGYFPANSSLPSVLGDLLSTGLGVLGLSWQSSPALTEVEEVATDWLRQMVGLSDAWKGVIQDTASTTTMLALICARERATGFSLGSGGMQRLESPLVVYASAYAHSSVDKAALLAGFGRDFVRHIACDDAFAMRADALEAAMAEDVAAGRTPCAVVATTGTTTSTAMDPVAAIVEVARRFGAFVHVDAAMGGSAMILPECRWMWDGIEGADSVVVNVHKWLGVAFDCTMHLVRDTDLLIRVMSTNPSYLRSSVDEQVRNYRDWGLPLGRRFRALKFWFLVREQGVAGAPGAAPARHRQCAVVGGCRRQHAGVARARPGSSTDAVRPAPTDWPRRRGARRAHAALVRGDQPVREGVPDARHPGRALDRARVDRRGEHRAASRRSALAAHAGCGGGERRDRSRPARRELQRSRRFPRAKPSPWSSPSCRAA